ncbi:hypothetical protein [Helicobacter pylori]|nr:hypothetical protein [Helicobacter pylori]WRG42458.1 hypothetical protein E5E21_06170 [Helicobacter pylori]WRG56706.1 hypothetical protein E5E17_06190 [Helicobacter pylori]
MNTNDNNKNASYLTQEMKNKHGGLVEAKNKRQLPNNDNTIDIEPEDEKD